MQAYEDLGEESAPAGVPMDTLMVFPEFNDNSNDGNSNGNDGQQLVSQVEVNGTATASSPSTPARGLQPLVPIAGSQGKDYPKCFVQLQPCYPFGLANVDEKMIVVTPDDDQSLYADAVVCAITS